MMQQKKREHPKEKIKLHPRNRHRERYDFKALTSSCPQLSKYVKLNEYNDESIDFFNPAAVMMLNKALLKHFYGIEAWKIPGGYLCPAIPGRADYIHHMADVLAGCNNGKIPTGGAIKVLDIGVGANCVYPIIGNREYGWSFTGSDTDKAAMESASLIIDSNPFLQKKIELRLQNKQNDIFNGIIQKDERFDLTICNPPFHTSLAEAQAGTMRKLSNLKRKTAATPKLNFGGQNTELWCEGGEQKFVENMIRESRQFSTSCFWFSSLISKEINLRYAYKALVKAEAFDVKTIPMGQGNKISRIIAWTFLEKQQQERWASESWNKI